MNNDVFLNIKQLMECFRDSIMLFIAEKIPELKSRTNPKRKNSFICSNEYMYVNIVRDANIDEIFLPAG